MEDTLFFGDNLDILTEYIDSASVDLVYLDPPFNSQANYNVLFETPTEDAVSAQAQAFRDMWSWTEEAEVAHAEVMRRGGGAARIIDALRTALGNSDMMAYLVMMAARLHELKRVLKPNGSLYLHCDPTASHYLKIILDAIFGPSGFTNEIVWKRTSPKGLAFSRYASNHDIILYYRGTDGAKWHPQYMEHSPEYLKRYNLIDDATGRRFQATSLLNPNKNRPNLTYEFGGHKRVWRWTKERMEKAADDGLIYFPPGGGVPREKRFLDEQEGVPVSSVWTDIHPVNSMARERIGYPTQKPLALLDRIINASSDEGDVVLDPFCGCGTTIEAAENANRRWIGIDVAIHAVKVIEARLAESVGRTSFRLEGIPRDFASAVKLAERDKFQFQWWANYLFNPHALREQKRGADYGIDGELFFPNGPGRPWGRMLTSVKGGANVGPAMVREFRGVLERERAELGLFICLYSPTRAMSSEAAAAGIADTVHGNLPRLQIVSIEDWFQNRLPMLPPLEHLPTAAFSSTRRRPQRPSEPDPMQPQFQFTFLGERDKNSRVHFNPGMVVDLSERRTSA